jgi:hypothetical protein
MAMVRAILGVLALVLAVLAGAGVARAQNSRVLVIGFEGEVFADRRVQDAVAAAADWRGLAAQAGVAVEAVSLRMGGETRTAAGGADPARARVLLAEAGYPEGLGAFGAVRYGPGLAPVAQAAVRVLGTLGFNGGAVAADTPGAELLRQIPNIVTGQQLIRAGTVTLDLERAAVQPQPQPGRLADLALVRLQAPVFDAATRRLRVTVQVENRGALAVPAAELSVSDRDGLVAFPLRMLSGLAPGPGQLVVVEGEVPDAAMGRNLVLELRVAASPAVPESDFANNALVLAPMPLPPLPPPVVLPDLVVAGAPRLDWDPDARRVTVRATVANDGPGPAGPSALALRDLAGLVAFPELAVPPLAPQASAPVEVTVPVPEAALGRELRIEVEADARQGVPETNEADNRSAAVTLVLSARALADLAVLRTEAVPEGDALVVEVLVANLGTVAAGPVRLALRDRNGVLPVTYQELAGFGPRESRAVRVAAALPERARGRELALQAEVEPTGAEADRANNLGDVVRVTVEPVAVAEPPFIVPRPRPRPPSLPGTAGLADLAVERVVAEPARGGTALRVRVAVANVGAEPVGRVAVSLSVGGERRAAFGLPELAPGEERVEETILGLPWRLAGGTVRVEAVADPDGVLAEADEANNAAVAEVRLGVPVTTWAGGGIAVALGALGAVVLMRRRPPAPPPAPRRRQEPRLPDRVRLHGVADPGVQRIRLEGPVVRLGLRPVPDAGVQGLRVKEEGR